MRTRLLPLLLVLGFTQPLLLRAGLSWVTTEQKLTADPTRTEIDIDFAFTNQGKQPVTIKEIKTSCGCTVAELAKRTYAPGEAGKVAVVLRYMGDVSPISQVVTIVTDEPQANTQELRILLHIPIPAQRERIEIRPQFIYWRRGTSPTPQMTNVRITNPEDRIRPVSVSVDDPAFRVALREPRFDDPTLYEVVITPLDLEHPRQATVTIRSNTDQLTPAAPPPQLFRFTVAVK
ncbi:MAG: DUF1573 domain-containing protein [Opitutae bacterium]|nr:DUF1573 domain-containing protein [Opitutae bacterium]